MTAIEELVPWASAYLATNGLSSGVVADKDHGSTVAKRAASEAHRIQERLRSTS